MMTMTLECVECGESVAYGRLSCPSCGALLAAVTGARRPAVRPSVVPAPEPAADLGPEPAAAVELAPDPVPEYTARLAKAAAATADPEPSDRFEAVRPALPAASNPAPARRSAPTPGAAPAPEAAPAAPTAKSATATRRSSPPKAAAQAAAPTAAEQPVAQAGPPGAAQPAALTPAAQSPADPQPAGRIAAKLGALPPSLKVAPVQAAHPAQVQAAQPAAAAPAAPIPAQPTADMEPSTVVRSVGASVTPPYMKRGKPPAQTAPAVIPLLEPADVATPPTPWTPLVEAPPTLVGRPYPRHLAADRDADRTPGAPPSAYRPPTMALATAGGVIASASSWSVGVAGSSHAPSVPEAVEPASPGRPLLDAARFAEIAGWFAIVGATMSVLGFLLPWSGIVIGSGRVGGYFDQWGLAGPTHPLVVLGLLGVLALAILRTPIPTWIWSTTVSLAMGGLVIGLSWPYLFGPLGAEVGVTVTALGGVALLVGGAVATWAVRHEASDPAV